MELFDVLVENGAEINYQSSEVGEQSALHLAAESGRLGFVKKLLHSGADPELKDRNGKRAIELASQNGKDRAKLALQGAAHRSSAMLWIACRWQWADVLFPMAPSLGRCGAMHERRCGMCRRDRAGASSAVEADG